MPTKTRLVKTGPRAGTVIAENGNVLSIPKGWRLLPPGDAAATRRLKAAGPSWTVKAKRGRRTISIGVYGDAKTISEIEKQLVTERSKPAYAKKLAAGKKRRDKIQQQYVDDFSDAVFAFLNFHQSHHDLAGEIAMAVAAHATPVGSGTVARTARIPVEQRAESAVIAWMRHQTTAYDDMKIPRAKGKRREVRRMLAKQSRMLLDVYRAGRTVDPERCVLRNGLSRSH